MRVGIILKRFPVLSESFVLRQIEGLSKRSEVKVVILTDFYDEPLLEMLSPSLYGDIRKSYVEVIFNKNTSNFFFLNSAIDHTVRAFFSSPFFIVKMLLREKVNFSNAIYSHFIRKLFKNNFLDIDVFHFQFLTTYISFSLLKNTISVDVDGKFVVSVRGYDCTRVTAFNKDEFRIIRNTSFFDRTYFLPVSESLKEVLAFKGISSKVIINYSGIDANKIAAKISEVRQNENKIKFIQVGRLVEKKGFGDSIVALSIIKGEYDFEFHIVGNGPNLSLYKKQVEALNLTENVYFHGALFHEETTHLIGCCDCLLVPSKKASNGDMEGIPNVIKEAMLLGTVVVASKHSGIPEIVTDEQTGFLHEEGVIESQVDAIKRLIKEKKNWPELIFKARDQVKNKFDIDVTINDLISIYKDSYKESD